MLNKLVFISATLLIFLIPEHICAEIRINEVYPAPVNGEYEWVELYNDEGLEIDLTNYTMKDLANNSITLSGIIEPFGFHIATSSSVLNNSGDTIYLLKNGANVDTVQFGSGTSENSFSRCPDGTDPFTKTTMITKNASNNNICAPTSTLTETPTPLPSPTPTLTNTPTLTPTPTPLPSNTPTKTPTNTPTNLPSSTTTQTPTITQTMVNEIQNIFISEIYPYPNSEESEWIELFNNNDTDVTLTSWSIDDLENAGSSPKTFTLSILSKSYARIILSSSIFNNDGDSVRLINSQGIEIDGLQYGKIEQGFSFGRNDINSDEICKQSPTPDANNETCLEPTLTPTETPTRTPTATKTPTNTKTPTPSKTPTPIKYYSLSSSNRTYSSQLTSKSYPNSKSIFTSSSLVKQNQSDKPEILSAYTDLPNNEPPIELFSLSGISLSTLNIVYMIKKLLS